jgi:hypothetical protein
MSNISLASWRRFVECRLASYSERRLAISSTMGSPEASADWRTISREPPRTDHHQPLPFAQFFALDGTPTQAAGPLQQPLAPEAQPAPVADDDVVMQDHRQHRGRVLHLARHLHVGA